MKKRLLLLTILFIFIFSFSASAANGFEISAGNNFLVLNENASEKEISDAFGMEEQKLKSYISANGIIYLAVNENNTKPHPYLCKTTVKTKIEGAVICLIPEI